MMSTRTVASSIFCIAHCCIFACSYTIRPSRMHAMPPSMIFLLGRYLVVILPHLGFLLSSVRLYSRTSSLFTRKLMTLTWHVFFSTAQALALPRSFDILFVLSRRWGSQPMSLFFHRFVWETCVILPACTFYDSRSEWSTNFLCEGWRTALRSFPIDGLLCAVSLQLVVFVVRRSGRRGFGGT